MKKFLKEFRDFAMRGNVLDLAVGVVIGASFGSITSSLVNDIIMPLINLLVAGENLSGLNIQLTDTVTLGIGNFLSSILDFIIIAFAIFVMLRAVNKIREGAEKVEEKITKKNKKKDAEEKPSEPKPTTEELLTQILEQLKKDA